MSEIPDTDHSALLASARIIYEGTHGLTMAQLAERTGLPLRTLKQAARDEGWRKKQVTKNGGVTEDALAAEKAVGQHAQAVAEQVAEDNRQMEANTKAADLIIAPLPGELNELLERHRKEWTVARSLSAEAVRTRLTNPGQAFDRAKLAKITAETLKLVQEGERKAFGLDKDVPSGVVVIDRG